MLHASLCALSNLHKCNRFISSILSQAQHKNGHERVLNLRSPKKMESDCDIIQQLCVPSDQNQMEITFKNQTMSDFMDDAATVDVSSDNNRNANEATVSGTMRRSHFVEIGEFSCGSIFGLGEHMSDRVIAAKHTEVQCLLIPHYWLFEKKQNAGNIWQRYTHVQQIDPLDIYSKHFTYPHNIEMEYAFNIYIYISNLIFVGRKFIWTLLCHRARKCLKII